MLVLSRQSQESIMIGDSIEITIIEIKGDKVRIGVSAPKNIAVHRKEIYLAIQQENLAAAKESEGLQDLGGIGELFEAHSPDTPRSS